MNLAEAGIAPRRWVLAGHSYGAAAAGVAAAYALREKMTKVIEMKEGDPK